MIYISILLIYITKSYGIGNDYYFENDEVTQKNANVFELVNTPLPSEINSKIFEENESENSAEGKFYYTTKEFPENAEVSNKVEKFNNSIDIDHRKMFESHQPNASDFLKPSMNLFEEYEYIYDEERYETHDSKYSGPDLNLRSSNHQTHQNKKLNQGTKFIKQQKQPKSETVLLIDYYNLEPAVSNVNGDTFSSDDENTWYVPEDLPCWQLPLLYGELKYKKFPNIFSIHRGSLNNVVHQENTKKSFPKVLNAPARQMFNKWCGIEPCYGDHTLCLFPDKTISTLCGKEYKVKTPTNYEQVALVNTVNSMRNRIASGESIRYSHLPKAANMMQVTYDYDLERMAYAWLSQCLPGPAPCSALDGSFVSQLECTKDVKRCCLYSIRTDYKCIPPSECFVLAVIGCIHIWYWSAGKQLKETDIQCGHMDSSTFNTVQLIWANTHKIGCAFGININGNIRVVCNFSPGAPYSISRKFYCGISPHKDITDNVDAKVDITNLTFLSSLGINLDEIEESFSKYKNKTYAISNQTKYYYKNLPKNSTHWGVDSLSEIYKEGLIRRLLSYNENGTKGMLARVVTQYTFYEESQSRCDTEEPIYVKGKPGSLCMEGGRRFPALCYHFRDPTPGYRLVAILAPITLFSLILYDLFSVAVRQTIH